MTQNLSKYERIIRKLSDKLVKAQRPIRILNAIKWDNHIKHYFFKHKCQKLPLIDAEYYQRKNPLSFNPTNKIEEFLEIERQIRRQLGQYSGVGSIMQRMSYEYRRVIQLLLSRGTPQFSLIAQELYGSSIDAFHIGAPALKDLGILAGDTLTNIRNIVLTDKDEAKYSSEQTVKILIERLGNYFHERDHIRVLLSDGIIADAAAGADKLRIRKGLKFSERDIRIFETHEGWVHLGTTLNGLAQPICTFLSKGPPSSTITQEGLAIITELFTLSAYPNRLHRIINRINAVNMAEQGANFFDVFQFHLQQDLDQEAAYQATVRIFRGSTPTNGPFTKDLAYSKGFILIYNYMRLAIQQGLVERIPLLFVGKTTLEDIHILSDLMDEGIVKPPKYLPPQFQDLAAISAWMVYSLFLNKLDLKQLAIDFKGLLQ